MTQKPYNSPELDAIRQKIDALDTRIHDTLVERAELVLKVGEEKRRNNIEIVQPAREARMVRRLLAKHKGALPEMAVVRIWRELVGAVSLLQTGLKVVVAENEGRPEYWDLAKDYFGSCLPMSRSASPLSALNAVRDGRATFAVVPYPNDGPDDEDTQPWWEGLDIGLPTAMKISVRLPHGDDPNNRNPDYRSLVVAKTGFDSSDEDHSFLYIECDAAHSRGKIVSLAEESGLRAVSLSSKKIKQGDERRRHLIEVQGYWQDDMAEIEALKSKFDEQTILACVGGYPVPPIYSKTILPQAAVMPSAPQE